MATLTFDTLKFVERLKSAGVPEMQAKAEAEALQEALGSFSYETLTKDYFEYRLKAEIESAKADIIKWVAALLVAQAGLVAALVKLL